MLGKQATSVPACMHGRQATAVKRECLLNYTEREHITGEKTKEYADKRCELTAHAECTDSFKYTVFFSQLFSSDCEIRQLILRAAP